MHRRIPSCLIRRPSRLPPPLRRVIGDLSDKEKVLLGLDVWPDAPATTGTEPQ